MGTGCSSAPRLEAHIGNQLLQLGGELRRIQAVGATSCQQHQIHDGQGLLLQTELFAHHSLDEIAANSTAYGFFANDKAQPGLGLVIETCEQKEFAAGRLAIRLVENGLEFGSL